MLSLLGNGIAAELHSASSGKERRIRNDNRDFVKALIDIPPPRVKEAVIFAPCVEL